LHRAALTSRTHVGASVAIVTETSHTRHIPVTRNRYSDIAVKAKILIVDDEPDAIELIEFNLKNAGFKVASAVDGPEALRKARAFAPDLIVLDLMLPGMDGLEVCKLLRKDPETASIAIIIVTAKAAEIDRVLGLEMGADDYITKPFSPRELVLRIKKQLKHRMDAENHGPIYECGTISVDVPRHVVTVEGKSVDLTAIEFKLISTLVQRRGRVQTREQLLKDVWEYDTGIDSRTVDTHMRRLRKKLGRSASYLDTVRGVGYRLIPPRGVRPVEW
jgi:two-component system phosphate regulon response regulator PhoB